MRELGARRDNRIREGEGFPPIAQVIPSSKGRIMGIVEEAHAMERDDEAPGDSPAHGGRQSRQPIAVAGMDDVGASELHLEQAPERVSGQRAEGVRNAQDVETSRLGPFQRMLLGGDDPDLVTLPAQILCQPEGSQLLSTQARKIGIGGDDDSQDRADGEGIRTRMSVFSEPSFS